MVVCSKCGYHKVVVRISTLQDDGKYINNNYCKKCADENGLHDFGLKPKDDQDPEDTADNLNEFFVNPGDIIKDIIKNAGILFVSDNPGAILNNLKGNSVFANEHIDKSSFINSIENKKYDRVCDMCGITYGDFIKTGKLGCSVCYKTFSSDFDEIMRYLHKIGNSLDVQHVGKKPVPLREGCEGIAEEQALRREKHNLEKAKKIATQNQDYKAAISCRDKIKELDEELKKHYEEK